MSPATPSFWKLPISIQIVSALNTEADLTAGEQGRALRSQLERTWPEEAPTDICAFLDRVDRVAWVVGGRDVLRAYAEEQLKLRTESVARLLGVLEAVQLRAKDLARREGDSDEDRQLRVIGNTLLKVLGPIGDGLTFPEVPTVTGAVLTVLNQHRDRLVGYGFPADLADRIAALDARVEADNHAARTQAATRDLASRDVREALERIVDFLCTYALRVDILRREGVEVTGFDFAEARHWHATRASEVQARQQVRTVPSTTPVGPEASSGPEL